MGFICQRAKVSNRDQDGRFVRCKSLSIGIYTDWDRLNYHITCDIINIAVLPCKASAAGVTEGVGEGGGLVEPVKERLLIFGTWTDPHRLVLASSSVIPLVVSNIHLNP